MPGSAGPVAAIGHNGGPPIGPGPSWARHCWTRARADLLPTLPLEVIRLRVRRAAEIGLDYRTYASIRASTGRDIVAFLYSTETLRLRPRSLDMPADRAAKLAAQAGDRLLLCAPDLTPESARLALARQGIDLRAASPAPPPLGTWRQARTALRAALAPLKLPGDAVVLVGEGRLQQDWAEAAHLAAFLPGDRFFAPALPG